MPPLPPPLAYPKINGRHYSHSSFRVKFGPVLVRLFTELTYKNVNEVGEVRGAARQADAFTAGEYKPECSCTMVRAEHERVCAAIDPSGTGYLDKPFLINVSIAERGMPTLNDVIQVVATTEEEFTTSAGVEAAMVKLTYKVAWVKPNGRKAIEFLNF